MPRSMHCESTGIVCSLTLNCMYRPTHWEQSVMYVSRPFAIRQADVIAGSITIVPSPSYQRLIALVLWYY